MTVNINIQEAEVAFSELLNRVSRGEEITITQDGVAIARLVPVTPNPDILNSTVPAIVVAIGPLVPVTPNPLKRIPGSAKGLITIAPDFDAPLPDDILASFEG